MGRRLAGLSSASPEPVGGAAFDDAIRDEWIAEYPAAADFGNVGDRCGPPYRARNGSGSGGWEGGAAVA